MSELSKSNNPRVRRAYAHAMLDKLAKAEVSYAVARSAISLADQTSKGRASNFHRALFKAEERGAQTRASQLREHYEEAFRNRPTVDQQIEIITGVPFPGGDLVPIVIGAGSYEDLRKAHEEGEEIALGPDGRERATNHLLKSMAEAGGVVPEFAFWLGMKLGQGARAEQVSDQMEGQAEQS